MEKPNNIQQDIEIQQLEMKLSYQERTISELNDLVFEQAKRLDRLETAFKSLAEKIKNSDSGKLDALPENERPPHY